MNDFTFHLYSSAPPMLIIELMGGGTLVAGNKGNKIAISHIILHAIYKKFSLYHLDRS